MSDDTGKRKKEWPLSGPVPPDEDTTDRHTAISDPSVRAAFLRLDERINGLMDLIEKVGEKTHKMANDLAALKQEHIEHDATDDGQFKLQDSKIDRIEKVVEKNSNAAAGLSRWVVGQAIVVIMLVIGWGVLMERRVSTAEAKLDAMKEKADDINRTLDKTLDKLEYMYDRFGHPTGPATP